MQTIANLWWLWLGFLALSGAYLVYNQIRRMRLLVSGPPDNRVKSSRLNPWGKDDGAAAVIMDGIGGMAAAAMIAWLSMILLVFSMLLNIFKY